MRDHRLTAVRNVRPGLALLLHTGLLLAFVASAPGCGEPKVREFPEELIGRWGTSSPMYRDRHMEFRLEDFELGQGPGVEPAVHELDHIEIEEVPGETRYTVHWKVDGERYSMDLVHTTAGGGTITFPNQRNMVWRRVRNPQR